MLHSMQEDIDASAKRLEYVTSQVEEIYGQLMVGRQGIPLGASSAGGGGGEELRKQVHEMGRENDTLRAELASLREQLNGRENAPESARTFSTQQKAGSERRMFGWKF